MGKEAGVTLLELLMALAIAALLTGLAVQGFRPLLERGGGGRMLAAVADSIRLARSAAARHNGTVTLCGSADGQTCNGGWDEGSILFIDHDGDRVMDAGDRLLQRNDFSGLSGTLRWRAFSSGGGKYLQVTPQGSTKQNGSFHYCPESGDVHNARRLIISPTGRIRYSEDVQCDGV